MVYYIRNLKGKQTCISVTSFLSASNTNSWWMVDNIECFSARTSGFHFKDAKTSFGSYSCRSLSAKSLSCNEKFFDRFLANAPWSTPGVGWARSSSLWSSTTFMSKYLEFSWPSPKSPSSLPTLQALKGCRNLFSWNRKRDNWIWRTSLVLSIVGQLMS